MSGAAGIADAGHETRARRGKIPLAHWGELRVPGLALFVVAIGFALVRSTAQPAVVVHVGPKAASIVPGDVVVGLCGLAALWLVIMRRPRETLPVLALVAAFSLYVLLSAAANGPTAFVAGAKMVELVALCVGAVAFVRSRHAFEVVVDVLLLYVVVADVWGVVEYVRAGGDRQAAFLGAHDLAALGTLPFVYGLALVHERRSGGRAAVAMVAGGLACVLGAALATLLGVWLGAAALLISARLRHSTHARLVVVTLLSVAVVTGVTAERRAGAFGFLNEWAGQSRSKPGAFAGSWSQRLLYTYIDGRVFLAHPLVGTGWYGLLPPSVFARYVPAARRRFPDQPANYFPPTSAPYIPQQTWDQVAAQLGALGILLFGGLIASIARAAVRAARAVQDRLGDIPLVWSAGGIGAVAGEALFGGSPLAGLWWLVVGTSAALAGIACAEAHGGAGSEAGVAVARRS